MYDMAKHQARQNTPTSANADQAALYYLSSAQQQLQSATQVVKRDLKIVLNPKSPTNAYNVPPSFRGALNPIQYGYFTALLNPIQEVPLDIVSVEQFLARKVEQNEPATPAIVPLPIGAGGRLACTYDKVQAKVLFYPLKVTGFAFIRHTPDLVPYSVTNDDDWPDYGADPGDQMDVNGPADEFRLAFQSMIDYCEAMITYSSQNSNQTTRDNAKVYAKRAIEEGITMISKNNVEPVSKTALVYKPWGGVS